jgi:hypothetical protein
VNVPVEVVEATQKGRCALFVGRRASLEAVVDADGVYPDQRKLARLFQGRISLREACVAYEERLGRPALLAALQAHLAVPEASPGSFHQQAVRRFDRIFTTAWDELLERAAEQAGRSYRVLRPGDELAEGSPEELVIVKLWGDFTQPETLVVTGDEPAARALVEHRKSVRQVLRKQVCFFVGYRPDEEEFDLLFDSLSEAYGGELPRCHLAVAQGRISDYHWQKWVWRGLLLFMADPSEALEALEAQVQA